MRKGRVHHEYHPRWYREKVSTYWWLRRWAYLKFIARELSSVFVAMAVLGTLMQVFALARGPQAYADFQRWLRRPGIIALSAVSLAFVAFHAITWFNLAPKAMPVRVRGKRVPDLWVAAPNYVAWVAVSALVAWFVLRA